MNIKFWSLYQNKNVRKLQFISTKMVVFRTLIKYSNLLKRKILGVILTNVLLEWKKNIESINNKKSQCKHSKIMQKWEE